MKTGEYLSRLLPGRKAQLSFDLMFAIIMVLFLVQLLAVVIGENNTASRSFEQMSLGSTLANNIADQMTAVNTARLSSDGYVEAVIKIPDNGLYANDASYAGLNYEVTINEAELNVITIRTDDWEFSAYTSLECEDLPLYNTESFIRGDELMISCDLTGCTCT